MSDRPNALFTPDMLVPPPQNALAPAPTWADAWQFNSQAVQDEVARQRAISEQRGLWNPETGLPTAAGVVDAAGQVAQGVLMGTTAPGFKGVPSVTAPRDLMPGEDLRVSTRIPTAVPKKGAEALPDPHTTADLNIGMDAAKDSPDAYAKNAQELRGSAYPDLPVKGLRSPDKIVEAAVDHMTDNLVWLHDSMLEQHGPDALIRASKWYDGANTIANDLAERYGYQPQQTAAAIANMSPQKDWYQNADLGKRLIDIVRNQQDQPMTPEMNDWATNFVATKAKGADTPSKQAQVSNLQMSLDSLRRGQTLGEINDPDTRALFVRAFDEAHNDRGYPIVTPEGGFAEAATNADGSPSKVGWGSFVEIKKALAALDAEDLPSISGGLGGNHKVRSFYNNIISPNAPQGDVTIDTHAIAAAHGRPLSGNDYPVEVGLGLKGSSDAATGSRGAYGLYHEAYQRAADRLGLLPRQMQSIAWEAVRGLFSPEQKRDTGFFNQNYDIWRGFKDGKYSADDARRMVMDHAGGIEAPSWWTPPSEAQTQ